MMLLLHTLLLYALSMGLLLASCCKACFAV
jgi:hypothetical protein